MKYLLLLMVSSHVFADVNFIKKSEIDKCSEGATYHTSKESCGEDCVAIESSVNCKDLDLIDGELVHNPDKAFARELAEKNAAEAARAKEEKCKAFSFKGTTIAQLRAELNEWAGECKK